SSLSVSQISDYLKCPYRFYLRHILQLSAEDDHLIELAPNFFSLLIHQVLFEFGRSALFKSTNENKIKEFLLLCLNKQVSNLRFLAMPTVKIQIKHLEQRLSMFSAWQAAQAKEWQIKEVEKSFNLPLAVYNSQEVELPVVKGRIDRVDIKKDSSEIIIIDYKATDKEINPVREHKVKGRWINAQLPLYWEFMRRQSKDLKIKTAYLLLLPSEVKLVEAKWQEEDLIEGVQSAVEAVEGIVKGSFWPPSLEEYSSFKEYDLFFSKGHYRGRGIK
ncbi:MAG: PD-(D/E)XK nuclease family protein, partial [Candidatus Dadabacteria bacterium]